MNVLALRDEEADPWAWIRRDTRSF